MQNLCRVSLENPLNARRSVVVWNISANLMQSPEFDPTHYGFYDYALWDEAGTMLKFGRLNKCEFNRLSLSVPEADPPIGYLIPLLLKLMM